MALEATFKEAAESFSKEINQTLTNDDLKEVYGLYKQVLSRAQMMMWNFLSGQIQIWQIMNAKKNKEYKHPFNNHHAWPS